MLVLAGAVVAVVVVRHAWSSSPEKVPEQTRPVIRDARVNFAIPDRSRVPPIPFAIAESDEELIEVVDSVHTEPDEPFDEAAHLAELEVDHIAELEETLVDRGAVRGRVHDWNTGEKLVGVTVVLSSPELGNNIQVAVTDEHGYYEVTQLPAGTYLATFFYNNMTLERPDVTVVATKVTPVFVKIDSRVIPIPRRTGDFVENDDGFGVSFSGTTSIEHVYLIDDPDLEIEPHPTPDVETAAEFVVE